ncbi:MAG: isopropylmalate synthase [Oscillospiraceae bacterium]
MIKIIDRTMSAIAAFSPKKEDALELLTLLIAAGADAVELNVAMYELLGKSLPAHTYILRIKYPDTAEAYPEFGSFVCRRAPEFPDPRITLEVQANDLSAVHILAATAKHEAVRVCGLDDLMMHNYAAVFEQLKKKLRGRTELCPENSFGFATAAAVEWLHASGGSVVTSFAGLGGFAAFEEVMMALRVTKRFKPNQDFAVFTALRTLLEKITGARISPKKAVIGTDIFAVEAGIHVNGILKQPKMYEPFPPELVGSERRIVLGKHSGKSAVLVKLKELGLASSAPDVGLLLAKIRKRSIENNSGVTDDDLLDLIDEVADEAAVLI